MINSLENTSPTSSLTRYWLLLGVSALAIAGLFSLILVIARTPSLANLPLFNALFHESLVVHVDLSVLVWFLSIACMMWSLLSCEARQLFPLLEEAALISFALGMAAIALSPLDPRGIALMSNYIPVIMSPVFFLGLALILCGVLLMVTRMLTAGKWSQQLTFALQFTVYSSGFIALIAVMSFFWSYSHMPKEIDGQQYYELLFWGGGHVLQFLHIQILLVGWILLSRALPHLLPVHWLILKVVLTAGLATTLVVPVATMLYSVESMEYREFFTHSMILTGGMGPTILALFILPQLWHARAERKGNSKALWSTLLMSIVLFLYGGFLGNLIQGQNVVIPAHYHGSIVGVTLGFMGVAYLFLPKFGYRNVAGWKLAYWQPIIYGGGQLLHISGLAWSGGYGVLRKTPGGLADVAPSVKAAMGLMGLGGLIAIIGGFMFVIIVWKSVRRAAH